MGQKASCSRDEKEGVQRRHQRAHGASTSSAINEELMLLELFASMLPVDAGADDIDTKDGRNSLRARSQRTRHIEPVIRREYIHSRHG